MAGGSRAASSSAVATEAEFDTYRSLIQSQVEYCAKQGLELRILGTRIHKPFMLTGLYHIAIPYAGTKMEIQAAIYAGKWWDAEEGEEEDVQVR